MLYRMNSKYIIFLNIKVLKTKIARSSFYRTHGIYSDSFFHRLHFKKKLLKLLKNILQQIALIKLSKYITSLKIALWKRRIYNNVYKIYLSKSYLTTWFDTKKYT